MSFNAERPLLKISSKKRKRPKVAKSKVVPTPTTGATCSGIPSILSGDIPMATATRAHSSNSDAIVDRQASHGDDCGAFDFEVPSDIIVAIRSLKQRHSYGTCNLYHSHDPIPFVLKAMLNATLYTTSNDSSANQVASAIASTGFDQELEKLCLSGEIRLIQVHGLNGEEDEAVFEMEDYLRGLQDAKILADTSVQDQRVIGLFSSVVKRFHLTHAPGKDLVRAMGEQNQNSSDDEYLLNEDKWIDVLISHQLLLPRRLNVSGVAHKGRESFWFVLPKLGKSAAFIKEGRRRMVLKLKRAPNHEIKRSSLEQNARGGMAGPFHVRDLLARGIVKRKVTANGEFVKLLMNS
mmetsp:Transcript_13408/g.20126  ORF Transcript_13408/g.20126 Transcript_13408/m.20126 type:complete len:350 (+) Transcript_13408:137-1186(+)